MFNLFSRNQNKSKNIAKDRLKLVLVHDRADISPQILERMKNDIIDVIRNYVDIDEDGIDFKVTRTVKDKESRSNSELVANIPILRVKNNAENR